MSTFRQVQPVRVLMGKLHHDTDLLEELTELCRQEHIHLGRVEALGAVKKAKLGYYDQGAREYCFFELDQPLEITKLIGNISMKDGSPMVHAHITLADADGKAYGGHLASGTIVFAGEFILEVFEGPEFARGYDDETGLPLWAMD